VTGRVIVVGDLVTDVVAVLTAPLAADSDTPARVRITGGGQAANTAAWLAGSGTPVTLVAAAGTDQAGDARVAELTAAGVDCAVVRRPGASTGAVVVLASGDRRTMVTDRGANLTLTAADVDAALAAAPDARHLHVSAYTLLDAGSRGAGLRALAAARERGLTSSVDAASAAPLRRVAAAFGDWVRGTDLLLANGDEAAVLTAAVAAPGARSEIAGPAARSGLAQLRGLVRVAVVVKRGAEGAVWYGTDGAKTEVPGTPATVVDATGAGDAFAAGLLAAWLAGAGPAEALRAGARLGALAVAQVGARPALSGPALPG
jgi:sugar/nucleoside kinase (ribokinase family)